MGAFVAAVLVCILTAPRKMKKNKALQVLGVGVRVVHAAVLGCILTETRRIHRGVGGLESLWMPQCSLCLQRRIPE